MGHIRDANGFGGKIWGERDPLEDIGLYGKITLKWIFRLIEIIHMTSR